MRLATFNILHGRSLEDGEVKIERFAAAVRDLDADVLALQEVDRDQPRSHGADLTLVAAEAMGAIAHRFVATLHGEPGIWVAATGDRQPVGAATARLCSAATRCASGAWSSCPCCDDGRRSAGRATVGRPWWSTSREPRWSPSSRRRTVP